MGPPSRQLEQTTVGSKSRESKKCPCKPIPPRRRSIFAPPGQRTGIVRSNFMLPAERSFRAWSDRARWSICSLRRNLAGRTLSFMPREPLKQTRDIHDNDRQTRESTDFTLLSHPGHGVDGCRFPARHRVTGANHPRPPAGSESKRMACRAIMAAGLQLHSIRRRQPVGNVAVRTVPEAA